MDKQLIIIPHLSFCGNCEEAIHTYIEAFGGEIYYLSRSCNVRPSNRA